MAGKSQTRRDRRLIGLSVAAALLASAVTVQAQTCTGKLPDPKAALAAGRGEKFRLIAQQCPALAEPTIVRRAAQLDLYDGARSVTVPMPGTSVEPTAPVAPPADPTASAPTTPPDRNAQRVLSIAPALTEAARLHDIDPLLLHAVAHIESRHNASAVSPAGARGVMQVMPATGKRFGVKEAESLFDAETNLRASASYLRTLRGRFGGDLKLMLAAYNAGEGAVDKHGGVPPYAETQAYVRDVMATYERLRSEFTVSATGALIARGDKQ